MTHAWLFTGPPGSGRSNAALAFAAALQCERGTGCGECHACRTALAGSHPDVSITRSETSMLYIKDMRELVHRSALAPVERRHQVMVIEDADRLGDASGRTGNTLLKAIEEPTPKTVWLLCAPTVEDVLPTIRSRCRNVSLATPTAREVARFLVEQRRRRARRSRRSPPAPARATSAGPVRWPPTRRPATGAARWSPCPAALTSLGRLHERRRQPRRHRQGRDGRADRAAATPASSLDLEALYGDDRKAKASRAYRAGLRELQHSQKQREKRRVMDVIDRGLMDIMSVYRDAIALQTGAAGDLVNEEVRDLVERPRPPLHRRSRTSAASTRSSRPASR